MVCQRDMPVQYNGYGAFVGAFTAKIYQQTLTIHWYLFRELQVHGSLQPIMAVQQVRIEVRLPEGHWAGDVTRSHPSAVLRIEEHMPLQKGRGTARASCSEEITATVSEHSGIEEVRSFGKQSFVVDIIAGGGGFLKPLLKVGVIPTYTVRGTRRLGRMDHFMRS